MVKSSWRPDKKIIDTQYKLIEYGYLGRYKTGKIHDDYEPFLQDCARIATFLLDENQVLKQLKQLNMLLVVEAKKQGLVVDEHKQDSYLKHKKVLRNVLENELEKIGFKPEFGKALDFLSPSVFRSYFSIGLLVKDPGAKIEHGEFTHAIQWLIIGWQQDDTDFFSKSVIDVFKQLGDKRSVLSRLDTEMEHSLWDILVDQQIDYCHDCRSPEHLHDLLRNNMDPDLSLLKVLSESRVQKRKLQEQQTTLFSKKQNLSNKNYEPSEIDKNLLLPGKMM